MKNITVRAMIANSNIAASLIRSTIKQFGGWKEFAHMADDVAANGADAGWSGFTYYTDTVPFAKRNKKAIIAMAENMAQELGESGAVECIANFQCLKNYSQVEVAEGLYNPRSDAKTDIYNALAWYALEEVARLYVDLTER